MVKILFIRPSFDDVTSYLYYYSEELVDESKKKAHNTLNKEKKDANKKTIMSLLSKYNPDFVMFNGHGAPKLICGHDNEILIQHGHNHNLLKKRITYSLSCSSASVLGKKIADKNSTFIGYTDEFALGMDTNCQASIHRDKRAKLFLDPSNLLVKSILKGNTALEAVKKAKELMKKNISFLRTDSTPDAKDYIPYLFNNYVLLEVFGKKSARLG